MQTFVGIDVSRDWLDVAVRPANESFKVSNDTTGHAELVTRLRPLADPLVVMEPTGGYEAALDMYSHEWCYSSGKAVSELGYSITAIDQALGDTVRAVASRPAAGLEATSH